MKTILDFWFANEQLWFNATSEDDKLITQKFSYLLTDDPDMNAIKGKCDKDELLAYILLYDQIIRHIYRGNQEKITKLSKNSFELSIFCLDNNLDTLFLPQERCFILMPLRHTFDLQFVSFAFKKILEYRKEDPESKYYIRFYKATILSLSKLKTPLIEPEEINNGIANEQIFSTLDPECIKNLEIILDLNRNEPIYKAFYLTIREMGKKGEFKEVTLSLSGGVDSMISSFILYHLSNKQKKFKIIAITIDYGNREDNIYEVEFVKRWCKLLGITHYVKHITELKRDRSHGRDLYEKLTRTLRFDMYRRFNNPVILGHNLGDCLENIFNNIKKTRSLNNLRGMSEFTEEDGCTIVRPMLNIPKKDIKDFAKRHMIPHLPNSTPSWSERGKIRDELIPFINQFDVSLIPGLLKLANNMKQLYDIYDSNVVERFYDSIVFDEYKVLITLPENAPEKKCGFVFWKDIICRMMKQLNIQLPSNKSMIAFNDRISQNQYGDIVLNENVKFKYTSEKLVYVLKPEPKVRKYKENNNMNFWLYGINGISLMIIFAIFVYK